MAKGVRPGSIKNKSGVYKWWLVLWRLPNFLFQARGSFLGGERNELISRMASARAFFSLGTLVYTAYTYTGSTRGALEPVQTTVRRWLDAGTMPRLDNIWATSLVYFLILSTMWIALFALLILLITRPRALPVMLLHLCWPAAGIALFAGQFFLSVKAIGWAGRHFGDNPNPGLAESVGALAAFAIICVWIIKVTYLAVTDVFRADDVHPLMAPFVTTGMSWTLAYIALSLGGASGVPNGISLLTVLIGPMSVTLVNIWVCLRIRLCYGQLLFRDGPPRESHYRPVAAQGASGSSRRKFLRPAALAAVVIGTAAWWAYSIKVQGGAALPGGAAASLYTWVLEAIGAAIIITQAQRERPVLSANAAGQSNARQTMTSSPDYRAARGSDAGVHHEDEPRPRFLTGLLPERAPIGARIALLAQVTLAASPRWASAAMEAFPVGPAGSIVTITVSARGLIPVGDLEQDLTVPASADSQPVRFGFIAGPAGLHVVEIRAFTGGTFLGELALQISVESGAALEEGRPRAALMGALAAEPGEVTLQVSRTAEDGYSFRLLSDAPYPMKLIDRLAGDPAEVLGQMVAELRAMSRARSPFEKPANVRKRLRNLGTNLWADVVPDVIREQFWEQHDRIRQFTIVSDIDTVPWELLHPVDRGNEDGFLVEQFPVVRRVYGQGRARVLRLDQGAGFIVSLESPANAMGEVAAVRGILPTGVAHRGTEAGLDAVNELLDAVPSVLHFAGHSAFTDEAGSVIKLDGGPLRPSDISYARQKRAFEAVSPLVFFNGCQTAAEIPGFTQMNGWATEFMGAGAGAFIGSLWPVRSSSARMFAEEFYRALIHDRQPLGAASLQARRAIAVDEGDPTWLAYTVYGNPSASFENKPDSRLKLNP